MDKISYDSKYKFIVSLGVFLIIAPFFIIYILSSMSNDMLITTKEMDDLNEMSAKIIEMKQHTYFSLIDNGCFYLFLIGIFIVGIVLIVIGLTEWSEFQKQEYRKRELDNEHSELENKEFKRKYGATQNEQITKVEKDIFEDNETHNKSENGVTSKEYFKIQQMVANRIVESFSTTHDVVNGFILRDEVYDVVARGRDFLAKDYIFEIRYLKTDMTYEWYQKLLNQVQKLYKIYLEEAHRLPYREIIIITEAYNFEQVITFLNNTHKKINNLSIEVIEKNEIMSYIIRR